MTIERKILEYFSNQKKPLYYKGIRIGFLGLPDFKHYKYQTLASRFSGLKQKGYLKEENGKFFITFKGREFLEKPEKKFFKNFSSVMSDKDPKNLMVIYDISEDKKSERDWFRRQLVNLNFIMIQRSVWIGPGPLPKDFLDYVKSIKIGDNFKTFKLEKGYKI